MVCCCKETGSGTLATAEGYDDVVEGEVVYGADWLLTDPDNEHARPNLKLLIKQALPPCGILCNEADNISKNQRRSGPQLDLHRRGPVQQAGHGYVGGRPECKDIPVWHLLSVPACCALESSSTNS